MGELTQAVVVTVAAAGALGVLLRQFVPARKPSKTRERGCPSCASGPGCGPTGKESPASRR